MEREPPGTVRGRNAGRAWVERKARNVRSLLRGRPLWGESPVLSPGGATVGTGVPVHCRAEGSGRGYLRNMDTSWWPAAAAVVAVVLVVLVVGRRPGMPRRAPPPHGPGAPPRPRA